MLMQYKLLTSNKKQSRLSNVLLEDCCTTSHEGNVIFNTCRGTSSEEVSLVG